MGGFTLLTLLDDITSMLDDVAAMTKVAARNTAGVLADDLALNAQQVTGVASERELPVVWAVAKGSLLNKVILIPAALLISTFIPWLVTPLLMLGGGYLCYEGAEKVLHHFSHKKDKTVTTTDHLCTVGGSEWEREKIRGAIRTDFVLSAEIIVISLSFVPPDATFVLRSGTLVAIGLLMTAGVYGLVAGIVKLDDLGLWLLTKTSAAARYVGAKLVGAAPLLMRFLAFVGTIAMFLVGGGILVHGLPFIQPLLVWLGTLPPSWLWSFIFQGFLGLIVGGGLVALGVALGWLRKKIT